MSFALLNGLVSRLQCAASPEDLEQVVTDISGAFRDRSSVAELGTTKSEILASSDPSEEGTSSTSNWRNVAESLQHVLENANLITNAKSRRRVKRLAESIETELRVVEVKQEVFDTSTAKRKCEPLASKEGSDLSGLEAARKRVKLTKGAFVSAESTVEIDRCDVESAMEVVAPIGIGPKKIHPQVEDLIKKISEVGTPAELEQVLAVVDVRQLSAPITVASTQESEAPATVAVGRDAPSMGQGNASGEGSAGMVLCRVTEWNCASRRKLKRSIQRAMQILSGSAGGNSSSSAAESVVNMNSENGESSGGIKAAEVAPVAGAMNAKVRRRLNKVIAAMNMDEAVLAAAAAAEREAKAAAEQKKKGDSNTKQGKQVKNIPYVVFIGQLPYKATAEDIEKHLRELGEVEGEISVRLLTNPNSGSSRGIAFVELETAKAMFQCIALHKSRLGGREISVERSCGGRDKDARKEKLDKKREDQRKSVTESTDRVLREYSEKGVLPKVESIGEGFLAKLHSFPTATVALVLKEFKSSHPKARSMALLDSLLDKAATDISVIPPPSATIY